ncbi:MAG: hypothetical protein FWE74_07645 [Oscillospiraceae bacterium]|nr:hypothetical protein [Oscillospiraceae bacterium]
MYVLHVLDGKEQEVINDLKWFQTLRTYAPKEKVTYRKGGVWREKQEVIFPGYVFVEESEHIEKLSPWMYYRLIETKSVLRVLDRYKPLPEKEASEIRAIAKNLDICKAEFVDGELISLHGWIEEFDYRIIKYSRRQRTALVEHTIYGEPVRHKLSVDII